MPVSFKQMPSANRVPGTFVEVDGSNALARQAPEPQRILLIGLKLAAGTALEGVVHPIVGKTDGDALFGANSQLAAMAYFFKLVNKSANLFAMALNEAGGGAAATASLPFTGTSTAAGTLTVRIGDLRASANLPSGTAAAAAATAINTAINAVARMPMTSTVATATATLAARHKGLYANELTVEIESIPAGLLCTPVQPSGGTTNPTMSTAITALDETLYDTICTGLTDATSVLALEVEAERRWGPMVKQPGLIFGAFAGSHGALTTYGNGRNSQFSVIFGAGLSPTPPWIVAAQIAALDAIRTDADPNRPRKGMTIPYMEAPKKASIFDAEQRNLLYYDGISSYTVDQSGRCAIDRLITTYQLNSSGLPDATYLAIETLRNLCGIYKEHLVLGSKYADYKLVPDGTPVDTGIAAISPSIFRGEVISLNDSLIRRARCYDAAGFEEELIVEIDESDHERLNVMPPHRLVGGLVTLAIKLSFRL